MSVSLEEQIGPNRFCIQPHVEKWGGILFKLLPAETDHSYLMLEALGGERAGTRLRLGKHLVKKYSRATAYDPGARFDGTLVLYHACRLDCWGANIFIEPSGETRLA